LGSDLDEGNFGNPTMTNIMLHNGELTYAEVLGDRFAERVQTTINFAFNSAVLDEQARAILREQAAFIRHFPEVRFTVYGHTDLVGSRAYNHRLGLRRARAAVNYIVSQGVRPLAAAGAGVARRAGSCRRHGDGRTPQPPHGDRGDGLRSVASAGAGRRIRPDRLPHVHRRGRRRVKRHAQRPPDTTTESKGPATRALFLCAPLCVRAAVGNTWRNVNVIPFFGPIVALFYGQFRLRSDPCGPCGLSNRRRESGEGTYLFDRRDKNTRETGTEWETEE
jgi:hypothetical protein